MTRGVTFRTVFGGPSVPLDFIEELTRLRHRLRGIAMQYDFDLFVVVGGDITVVTDPTGSGFHVCFWAGAPLRRRYR